MEAIVRKLPIGLLVGLAIGTAIGFAGYAVFADVPVTAYEADVNKDNHVNSSDQLFIAKCFNRNPTTDHRLCTDNSTFTPTPTNTPTPTATPTPVPGLSSSYSCVYASDGLSPNSTIQVSCSYGSPFAQPVYGWGTTLLSTPFAAHCVQTFAGWGSTIHFYPGLEVGCADSTFVTTPFPPGNKSCGTITVTYVIPPGGPAITVDLFKTGGVLLGSVPAPSIQAYPIPGC